jgi:hypothetical protein
MTLVTKLLHTNRQDLYLAFTYYCNSLEREETPVRTYSIIIEFYRIYSSIGKVRPGYSIGLVERRIRLGA